MTRRAYTAAEMQAALEKAGVSAGERAEAVARLRELGYMDDLEVARTRARTLLGLQPSVTLEEGLRDTVAWYVNRARPEQAGGGGAGG